MFKSKYFKFLMPILKWQVNSFSNFASSFIVMTYNSSVNFKLIHFLLCAKVSHEGPYFDTFKCSGGNLSYSSCHFPNHKSVFLQSHPSVSWKIIPLYFFRSNIRVKTHQILVIFETTDQFFFKFCINVQGNET